MIALRTLTRNHVVSMFPPKLLALLINANDRCFGCPRSYPREPPGHTPPAFLFLSSTMSNSGEDLLTLRSNASDTNRYRSPLGRYRHLFGQLHNECTQEHSHRRAARVPQWRRYRWDSPRVSSILSRNFCPCKISWKTRFALPWVRPVGPAPAGGERRRRRNLATIATQLALVNETETVCCETTEARNPR